MPTVGVPRDILFQAIGTKFAEAEFDDLCFQFGIELDDVTSETINEEEVVIYKFDIPANRYDLLCTEGLSRALRIFLDREDLPEFKLSAPASGKLERIIVNPSTTKVRPFIVGAILRDVTFDAHKYKSFLDLQDKLHQNICRRRTLVAIGTHDYDVIQGPFTYDALPPGEISFVPLHPSDRGEFRATDLLDFYNDDPSAKHLKPYTGIIYNSEVYPVVLDANRVVCSLPPVINGNHSKISEKTKNVFIECTATDLTKANIVLDTMVTMFSELCSNRFSVEPVEVVYKSDRDVSKVTPLLEYHEIQVKLEDLHGILGLILSPEKIMDLSKKMQLIPLSVDEASGIFSVRIPPTRADILHAVDVIEDIAIAYGYNSLPLRQPESYTVGSPLPLNAVSDLLREEISRAGYMEILTHGLCDFADIQAVTRKERDPHDPLCCPVQLCEGDFEVVRTTLLPGMLKTLQHNRSMPVKDGIRLFEVSDVVLLDKSTDTGARNVRHICTLFRGNTAGFEIIHGLLDRIMQLLQIAPSDSYAGSSVSKATGGIIEGGPWRDGLEYFIVPAENPTFFPGRCADVRLRKTANETAASVKVGTLGILHPEVLQSFEVGDYPASVLEINLELLI